MSASGISRFFAREQVQQWGVLSLLVLLLFAILFFIFLVLMPDVRRRTEYSALLISLEEQLSTAQLAKAEAPGKLQIRLQETQGKLSQVAQGFLTEAESTVAVNRLYLYADEAGAEIVNLQAAPAVVAPTHTQRDYQFKATGTPLVLLNFLGRIDEVALPGFVISNVAIVPAAESVPTATSVAGDTQHTLTMNVTVLTSPYATRMVAGATQEMENFANVGDLPLAEIQRRVEMAWTSRDWDSAVELMRPIVESAPENEAARTVLYRAHINKGYHFLTLRDGAAAKAEFEAALLVRPDGKEATAELQQIASDSNLANSVEDQLRQQVVNAQAAGNWQEVIRLLRIIAAVDSEYGPVGNALTEAYINYGNQLAQAGDTVRAEEQYQLAQYSSPNQPQSTTGSSDGVIVPTQPTTGTIPADAPTPAPISLAP